MRKLINDHVEEYFATARERYMIKLRREEGAQILTMDPHFAAWRFCHLRREDDKTTIWFRDNIREPLNEAFYLVEEARDPELSELALQKIVESTLIFRWFNKIETGEIIKDLLLGTWNVAEARLRLLNVSPVVTGAYIIKGPDGMTKLDGVLHCVEYARKSIPDIVKRIIAVPFNERRLESTWNDLRALYYLGPFMSYEAVSDLRWTPLLDTACDIHTWANAGPGCARGLWWLTGRSAPFNSGSRVDQKYMLGLMQELHAHAYSTQFWPNDWPDWEMREVEHWLCEYDKYKRAQAGQRLKRRFENR